MAGMPLLETECDGRAALLAGRAPDGTLRLTCANLTPDELTLDLSGLALAQDAVFRVLDTRALAASVPSDQPLRSGMLRLGPYATAFSA